MVRPASPGGSFAVSGANHNTGDATAIRIATAPAEDQKYSVQVLARADETRLREIVPQIVEIRRRLHRFPELSGAEQGTTQYLRDRLRAAGLETRVAPSGRGFLAEVSVGPGATLPLIALRADIDALPIQEMTEVPFRSQREGVMHACGHDAHAAMLVGAALLLQGMTLPVTWRCVFQPSEEIGLGAQEMMRFGALAGAKAILALHVDPNQETGRVGITPGSRSSFCQDFIIHVRGRGGHGARPHLSIDPIASAAHLVTAIYQAVPRAIDARDPAVVTIGQIAGGHAANVIPDEVILKGTIRTLGRDVSAQAQAVLLRVCAGVQVSSGATIECTSDKLLSGVVNDPAIAAHCQRVAAGLLGVDRVTVNDRPSLGAEDFADYLTEVPGCMITLGVRPAGSPIRPLHTATFDLDEGALGLGAQLLALILTRWNEEMP